MESLNRFYVLGTIVSKPVKCMAIIGKARVPKVTFEMEEKRAPGRSYASVYQVELMGESTEELYDGENVGSEVIAVGNLCGRKGKDGRYVVTLQAKRLIYNSHKSMEEK